MKAKTIFLFPGQGSQSVGMGHDLYQAYPLARRRFDQADEVLGYPLSRICFEGPADVLDSDLNAQLAVYTVSCILCDLLKQTGIQPDTVTGYSSGYYAAAYAAGALSFGQGLTIVKQAGEILISEGRQIAGHMAVIFGVPYQDVATICTQVNDVDVAIINTRQQVIVSGLAPAVTLAMERCLAAGALDAYALPAETAYHSRFMAGAQRRFREKISGDQLRDPQIPIISYVTLNAAPDKDALVRTMASQLAKTVRWLDLIRMFCESRPTCFMEVGPGAVISRAVRWIDREVEIFAVGSAQALRRMIKQFSRKAG
jgi:[acyl-carrier-protein] S-malonyltransferase